MIMLRVCFICDNAWINTDSKIASKLLIISEFITAKTHHTTHFSRIPRNAMQFNIKFVNHWIWLILLFHRIVSVDIAILFTAPASNRDIMQSENWFSSLQFIWHRMCECEIGYETFWHATKIHICHKRYTTERNIGYKNNAEKTHPNGWRQQNAIPAFGNGFLKSNWKSKSILSDFSFLYFGMFLFILALFVLQSAERKKRRNLSIHCWDVKVLSSYKIANNISLSINFICHITLCTVVFLNYISFSR